MNNYDVRAILNILISKGILTEEEFQKEVKEVSMIEPLKRLIKMQEKW